MNVKEYFDKTYFKDVKKKEDLYSMKITAIPEVIPNDMPKYAKSFEERFAERTLKEPQSDEEMTNWFDTDFMGFSMERSLKEAYNDVGMYAFVSWKWINPLVEWINGRKVLEVMAGRGWVSKALREKGIDVIATDDFSWANKRGWKEPLTEVKDVDAVEAVKLFGGKVDIVIMGWPYMDNTAYQVIKELHKVNPKALVVYIGEGGGGCTADDDFHSHFEEIPDEKFTEVERNYQQWYMIHDWPALGRYTKNDLIEDDE